MKINYKRHLVYGSYVWIHKINVFRAGWHLLVFCPTLWLKLCFVWRLFIHDWTKFLPGEWFPYACYFYQADGSRHTDVTRDDAFNVAWNHHQKRHPHHWQYHILHEDKGGIRLVEGQFLDTLEMLADWGSFTPSPLTLQSILEKCKAWYKGSSAIQLHANSIATLHLIFAFTPEPVNAQTHNPD